MNGLRYRTVDEVIEGGQSERTLVATKADVERVCMDPAQVVEKLEDIEREIDGTFVDGRHVNALSERGRMLLGELRGDLDRRAVAARIGK